MLTDKHNTKVELPEKADEAVKLRHYPGLPLAGRRGGSRIPGWRRTRLDGGQDHYWSSTRVPLIVWVLNVLRKLGSKRSMSSK